MATKRIILIAIAVVALGVSLGVGLTYHGGAPPLSRPTIAYSPLSFSFTAAEGGANPEDQTLEIWNSGGGTLNWHVSDDVGWLSLSPVGGFSTGEHNAVTVSVNISGMTAGSYNATITISACCPNPTNSPQHVPVSLTIIPPPAELTIGFSPSSFHFAAALGGSNPADQTLSIWNAGGGTLNWSVSADPPTPQASLTSGETMHDYAAIHSLY